MNEKLYCERLIKIRKENGFTQSHVAQALGVSNKAYSKWETGENEMSVSMLIRLSNFYKISPSRFFDDAEITDTEEFVKRKYSSCDLPSATDMAFEIQFQTIRQLAEKYFNLSKSISDNYKFPIPENRVKNNANGNAVTKMSVDNVFFMMYNGKDANISVSQMPSEENYSWIETEQEQLSNLFKLLGDKDFLKCLPILMSDKLSDRYSAKYLSQIAKISEEKTNELLCASVQTGICISETAYIGAEIVTLFTTVTDKILTSILTLAHIMLPETEYSGCYCCGGNIRNMLKNVKESL